MQNNIFMYYKKNQILVKILLSESVIDDEKKNLNSFEWQEKNEVGKFSHTSTIITECQTDQSPVERLICGRTNQLTNTAKYPFRR